MSNNTETRVDRLQRAFNVAIRQLDNEKAALEFQKKRVQYAHESLATAAAELDAARKEQAAA